MRRYQKKHTFMMTQTTPCIAGAEVAKCIDPKIPELQHRESILPKYEAGENMIHVNADNFITIEDCGSGYINVEHYQFVGEA